MTLNAQEKDGIVNKSMKNGTHFAKPNGFFSA